MFRRATGVVERRLGVPFAAANYDGSSSAFSGTEESKTQNASDVVSISLVLAE